MLAKTDGAALEVVISAYQEWRAAEAHVKKHGLVLAGAGKIVHKNPCVGIAKDARKQVMDGLKEFGLTPASRSKVTAGTGAKANDPVADLLNKRKPA